MPDVEKAFTGSGVDVSIIMPCLNEAGCLPACIANAREALEMMRESYGLSGEIVIADNGSTDGSPTIAEKLGARCVHVARRGYGAASRAAPRRPMAAIWSWATRTAPTTFAMRLRWSAS